MNVIQQSIWEHNAQWYRNNIEMLKTYVEQLKQGNWWPALITYGAWGASEQARLQWWEQARSEYHLPECEALQQEEAALLAEIKSVRGSKQ